jgi:hypothetical protein
MAETASTPVVLVEEMMGRVEVVAVAVAERTCSVPGLLNKCPWHGLQVGPV